MTQPLQNSEKHTLFVLSVDNSVYWDPESRMDPDFEPHKVEYELPEDGTLRFSTPEGAVSLTFSRAYDVEEGTAEVGSFKVSSPLNFVHF